MKVLAILSQKGGVGKTTLATCLAVAAEQAGKVAAIIDLDPQATASFWKDVRQLDTPAVASIQPVRLPAMLKACEDAGTDLVVIDGAAVARDVLAVTARGPIPTLEPGHLPAPRGGHGASGDHGGGDGSHPTLDRGESGVNRTGGSDPGHS